MINNNQKDSVRLLSQAKIILFDFDGVIKESVEVKGQAFAKLFQEYGSDFKDRVIRHHYSHGGMSRLEKLPIYLSWAGIKVTDESINEYSQRFSDIVCQSVIDSDWVPGVEQYIRSNRHNQLFILVSATPHSELQFIINSLELSACFNKVYGAPAKKEDVIKEVIQNFDVSVTETLMIGDAESDFQAARINLVPFLLRRSEHNAGLMPEYTGSVFNDFEELQWFYRNLPMSNG